MLPKHVSETAVTEISALTDNPVLLREARDMLFLLGDREPRRSGRLTSVVIRQRRLSPNSALF